MIEGWQKKTLGEIAVRMADGPFGSNLKKEHYTDRREVRIIQLSNIGEDGWREDNTKYTTFEHLTTIARSEVSPNDIVIAKMMPAGRAIICPSHEAKFVLSSDAVKVEVKKSFNLKFILYSINSPYFRSQVYENVAGSGRVRTSLTKLKDCVIRFPAYSEQERIVERLEEGFAKIDALKVNAEKSLQNAKDLLDSAICEEFKAKNGWKEKTIGEVCSLKSGNSSANNSPDGSLPFVKVGDMTIAGNEEKITCSSRYVDYDTNKKGVFPVGTVIFPKRGGAILTNKKRICSTEVCCDLNIMGVIPTAEIYPQYLFYFFKSVDLAKICDGASIPQINNGDIAPLPIAYPSLNEQKSIVARLEVINKKCHNLQENFTKTRVLCDDLKQALLRKAFNGEL